jgi:hypothetical protein
MREGGRGGEGETVVRRAWYSSKFRLHSFQMKVVKTSKFWREVKDSLQKFNFTE